MSAPFWPVGTVLVHGNKSVGRLTVMAVEDGPGMGDVLVKRGDRLLLERVDVAFLVAMGWSAFSGEVAI